jgi:WD40 repeat protein
VIGVIVRKDEEAEGEVHLEIFELATGQRIAVLPAVGPTPIHFTPNRRALMTASSDFRLWNASSGRELGHWPPRGSPISSWVLAISPDGSQFATGHQDGSILLWPMPRRAPAPVISATELDRLWSDLGAEAAAGWAAIDRLSDSPQEAVKLFRERLRPTAALDAARIRPLITDLDNEQPPRRAAARRELARYADIIQPMLRGALATSTSAEKRKSLQGLLELTTRLSDPQRLRRWRAVVVLERIATPDARKLLELIAQSPPGSIEADAARQAIGRIQSK